MHAVGRFLIVLGSVVILIGITLTFAKHVPWLGRLPGDIVYQKNSLRIYFPIVSGVVLSVILTLIINLVIRR